MVVHGGHLPRSKERAESAALVLQAISRRLLRAITVYSEGRALNASQREPPPPSQDLYLFKSIGPFVILNSPTPADMRAALPLLTSCLP